MVLKFWKMLKEVWCRLDCSNCYCKLNLTSKIRYLPFTYEDPEGVTGGPDHPTLKNHKFIGFPSITGADPLKITKLMSQHSLWAIIS